MRKFVLSLLVIMIAGNTYAKVSEEDHEQNCRMLMDIAEVMIKAKQKGMPLSKALDAEDNLYASTKNKDSDIKYIHKMTKLIIIDAYKQPNFSTAEYRQQQLNEYPAKYYIGCMEMYD